MNKDWFRNNIAKFERDIQVLFYEQLILGTSKRKCLTLAKVKLFKMAKRLGLKQNEIDAIWTQLHGTYLTMQHKTSYLKTKEKKANILALILDDKTKRVQMVGVLNKIEARKKKDELDKLISNGTSPFYLCSQHLNSAPDHKDYQGKIYINQDWRNKVTDKETQDKIKSYIKNHKIRTIEWVIGAPVYMTTRPNCKHYFINVDIDVVLHSSAKALCKRLDMIVVEKLKDPQKQKDKAKQRERLRIEALRKVYDCTELQKQKKRVK